MHFSNLVMIAIVCLALIVVFVVGRPILHAVLRARLRVTADGTRPLDWRNRLMLRYQELDMDIWMFSRFKTRLDPMFPELSEFLKGKPDLQVVLDLGCGYGFAGSYLLDCFPGLEIYAIEPNPARVCGAAIAFGDRGHVFEGAAPDFERSELPDRFDAVFILDVVHFLSDSALDLTLQRVRSRLDEGKTLFLRAPMKPAGFGSFIFNMDRISRIVTRSSARFRTEEEIRGAMIRAGFTVTRSQMSGGNPELYWFIATRSGADQLE